jgi:integrase
MATISRRKGRKHDRIYITFYDVKKGRIVQVPRSKTKHLDGLSQEQVQAWVDDWEATSGKKRERIDRFLLKSNDPLAQWWASYQDDRRKDKNVGTRAMKNEEVYWRKYILEFFIKQHELKDIRKWAPMVPQFHAFINSHDQIKSVDSRKKVLWVLERFSKYLVFQRVLTYPFAINLPRANKANETPLPRIILPEEALHVAKTLASDPKNVPAAFMMLCGYFASLRPEETGALLPDDFLTGEATITKCTSYDEFKGKKLETKLSIFVNKALTIEDGIVDNLKTVASEGVSIVWNREAALLLAGLLKQYQEQGALGRRRKSQSNRKGRTSILGVSRGQMDKIWFNTGRKILGGITLHDLRRASLLYLGRRAKIAPLILQSHARHADFATTEIYCREPKSEKFKPLTQNFDDVV